MMHSTLCGRDFLRIDDLSPVELSGLLDLAAEIKRHSGGRPSTAPTGHAVGIVLQKPSMRTRVSFEVACVRLGAHPVIMSGEGGAFSRGESVKDTARVMERYVDAIVVRTFAQSLLDELAEHASVPVINALTDEHHPCQGLADLLTIRERFSGLSGVHLTYVGDGNNMAHTYLLGGALAGMHVRIATPQAYQPQADIVADAERLAKASGGSVAVVTDPEDAVSGAQVVVTDTWASMGQEAEHEARIALFEPYRVTAALMGLADPSAIFMHCLPAHRGEEVTDEVMDGPHSVIYDEAENRVHAQQALLSLLLPATDREGTLR